MVRQQKSFTTHRQSCSVFLNEQLSQMSENDFRYQIIEKTAAKCVVLSVDAFVE
jgi:hypothetical protein